MTAHKWAKEMAQYAQDAAETDEPWRRWQIRDVHGGIWNDMGGCPTWDQYAGVEYRRKPPTITCNGFEVEAPRHSDGPEWWQVSVSAMGSGACAEVWGFLVPHATRRGAIAHAKAMCGIDPQEGSNHD